MKRYNSFRLSLFICTVLLLVGCSGISLPSDTGNRVREERPVEAFTAISLCCGMHLEFTQADQTMVVLEGDDALLPDVETFVRGEELTVRFRQTLPFFSFRHNRALTVIISAPTLQGLDLSGGSQAQIDTLETDQLHLEVSGGSHINMATVQADRLSAELSGGAEVHIDAGSVNQQEVDASGGSHYRLEKVQSSSATVDLSGGSEARMHVSEALQVNASGGSELDYSGSPTVDQDVSGGSRIRNSNE